MDFTRLAAAFSVVALCACTTTTPPSPPDASPTPDATTLDAGRPDAHRPDAAWPDSSIPDAGVGDASTPDAAVSLDASIPDSSSPDAAWDEDIIINRSLAWSDPTILDDPTAIGLPQLLSAMCPGVNPGVTLDAWLRKFGTTAHSERFGPVLFADELATQHGSDPTTWPFDQIPIIITGIHNRLDLSQSEHCGEFRVSAASVHPIYRPLHFIWLFRANGVDCMALARRWASLSTLDEPAFQSQARVLLQEHIVGERFLIAETVEFTVSPWEWRQWTVEPSANPEENVPCVLENPPLFQQVNRDGVNQEGLVRESFIEFVEENAAQLNMRTLMIPEEFRSQSIRAAQGVPWVPLDLSDVSSTTLNAHPQLRQNVEMIGCAACHATDAPFVQTLEDRTRSPFYEKELEARRDALKLFAEGTPPVVPFGPLQEGFLLPP